MPFGTLSEDTMAARLLAPALAALLTAGAALAHSRHDGFNINVHRDGEPQSCADIEVDAGSRAVATAEQTLTVPRSNEPLIVHPASNSGVTVSGWDRDEYEVLVCKAAAGRRSDNGDAAARARVGEIEARLEGRRLVTTGPSGDEWVAFLIIHAPTRAVMEIETRNGPLDVRAASGRFTIRGENGSVDLHNVGGEITVDLENGPVSLEGVAGSVRVRTENGPIDIHLHGSDWRGQGLDARAINGPVSLKMDDSYTGGVVVESSGHAPWSCGKCGSGSRTWDDDSRRVSPSHNTMALRIFIRSRSSAGLSTRSR